MVSSRLIRSALLRYVAVLGLGVCICALYLIGNHLFEKIAGRALF